MKRTQTASELKHAPEETQALFKTITSTRSDIVKAREKRVALSKTCKRDDLTEWDRSVRETEAALADLEKLVEPFRIDLQHNGGKLKAKTRLMWAMRDSKSVPAITDRLSLAHQRMLFAMLMTHVQLAQQTQDSNTQVENENTLLPGSVDNGFRGRPEDKLSSQRRENDPFPLYRDGPSAGSAEKLSSSREPPNKQTLLNHQTESFEGLLDRHEDQWSPTELRPGLDSKLPLSAFATRFSQSGESLPRPNDSFIPSGSEDSLQSATLSNHNGSPAVPKSMALSSNEMSAASTRPSLTNGIPQISLDPSVPSLAELDAIETSRNVLLSSIDLSRDMPPYDKSFGDIDPTQQNESQHPAAQSRDSSPPTHSGRTGAKGLAERMISEKDAAFGLELEPTAQLPMHRQMQPDYYPHRPTSENPRLDDVLQQPPDKIGPAGLKTMQYAFAGHRQPVRIRWQPEPDNDLPSQASSGSRSFSKHSLKHTQTANHEHVYRPYRKT